ncbi:MAG: anaerobic ribonucleoside-triphosphate reductase activating protein [Chloroflexi bacterium]|nr:anaerobic ribonucleoside-triphosphate reductase activating protein [Chloroflexota bacterium]
MKIAGLQRVTLIDFPDRIAATVFIAGCNLDCGFCHNRWMLDEREVDESMTLSDLYAWLRTRVGKLDGICITGGEPLMAEGLADLCREIKSLGLEVKLDTNGLFPARLASLMAEGLLDYVAMDVKAPLDKRYSQACGVEVDLGVLERTMALLRVGQVPWEFRTTVHPFLERASLLGIARALQPTDAWVLQPFVAAETVREEVRGRSHLSVEELEALLPMLRTLVPAVWLRAG